MSLFIVQWLKDVVPGGPVVNFSVERGIGPHLRCHVQHTEERPFQGDLVALKQFAATLSAQHTAGAFAEGATLVCVEGERTARVLQGRSGLSMLNLATPVPSLI